MALLENDTQVHTFAEGLDHPEGIAWGLDGNIYAGGEAGQIYRISLDGKTLVEFANTGGFILGIALDAANNIYACDIGNRCIQRITPGGIITTYSTGSPDEMFTTPNYLVFDGEGNLYVCDSGEWKLDNGRIFKICPGGHTEVWDRRLKEFPNGVCLGPDGKYLAVAMSLNPPRVAKIMIDENGSAGEIETMVNLPGTVPDGVAFDEDGNLYIACYRPDRIYSFTTSGNLDIVAEDQEGTAMACPTNIAFCGRNLDMFLAPNLGRWHITRYEVGKNGMPLHYPDLGSGSLFR